MLKTALVILFVMSCGCPAESRCAAPTLDADDIFYTAMDNYYSVVNASGQPMYDVCRVYSFDKRSLLIPVR